MGRLKSSDLLGSLSQEQTDPEISAKPTTKRKAPAQPKSDLEDRRQAAHTESRGKPSPYESELREKLRHKIQLSFGLIPQFINEEFNRLAKSSDMNKREFFYHLLRQAGAEIPPYEQLDGRKL